MSLGCSLTLSKYWRQVIFGSVILRHKLLLLERPLVSEFLEIVRPKVPPPADIDFFQHPYIDDDIPYQSVLLASHQILVPLAVGATYCADVSLKHGATHMISPEAMETAPPRAALFEPSLRKVRVFYSGLETVIEKWHGVTFGHIIDSLKMMRKSRYDRISEIVQYASARSNRALYAEVLVELNGPLDGRWWSNHLTSTDPFIYIKPESMHPFDGEYEVRMVQREKLLEDYGDEPSTKAWLDYWKEYNVLK